MLLAALAAQTCAPVVCRDQFSGPLCQPILVLRRNGVTLVARLGLYNTQLQANRMPAAPLKQERSLTWPRALFDLVRFKNGQTDRSRHISLVLFCILGHAFQRATQLPGLPVLLPPGLKV